MHKYGVLPDKGMGILRDEFNPFLKCGSSSMSLINIGPEQRKWLEDKRGAEGNVHLTEETSMSPLHTKESHLLELREFKSTIPALQ